MSGLSVQQNIKEHHGENSRRYSYIFLALAYYMFVPETVCTVEWLGIDGKPADGPFYECNGDFQTRHIGFLAYAKVGNDVYRVSQVHSGISPSEGLRPKRPKRFILIKFDSAVDWDKLESYLGGRYLSDGKVILNSDGRSILSLAPPLDIANLRSVPGPSVGSSLNVDYATDGRWVILHDRVVEGADATTFRSIPTLELDGSQVQSFTKMEFGRDKNSVYHAGIKLENADPDSFGLVSYNLCRNPPAGVKFSSDQVERGAGWVAVDRSQAWEVGFTGITSLLVTDEELHSLQDDLKKATAASNSASRKEFDGSICNQ